MIVFLELLETEEDKEKFEQIYIRYRDRMYYTAFKLLKNKYDSENVVHDTFMSLLKIFPDIPQDEVKLWCYIKTAVINKTYNLLKKQKRQIVVDSVEIPIKQEGEDESNLSIVMSELIEGLAYPYKQALFLKYYNDLTYEEISHVLDKKPANVKMIVHRAKKQLKKELYERGITFDRG